MAKKLSKQPAKKLEFSYGDNTSKEVWANNRTAFKASMADTALSLRERLTLYIRQTQWFHEHSADASPFGIQRSDEQRFITELELMMKE